MLQQFLDTITTKAETIRIDYSVNPWIFLGLLLLCAPFFYYSVFRIARSALRKDSLSLFRWSGVFLAATSIPYLYVMLFGRNMPWWIYLIFGVLLAQGLFSLVKKIRKSAGSDKN